MASRYRPKNADAFVAISGTRLHARMKERKDISFRELADLVNGSIRPHLCEYSTISSICHGKQQRCRSALRRRLAKVLDAPEDWLAGKDVPGPRDDEWRSMIDRLFAMCEQSRINSWSREMPRLSPRDQSALLRESLYSLPHLTGYPYINVGTKAVNDAAFFRSVLNSFEDAIELDGPEEIMRWCQRHLVRITFGFGFGGNWFRPTSQQLKDLARLARERQIERTGGLPPRRRNSTRPFKDPKTSSPTKKKARRHS